MDEWIIRVWGTRGSGCAPGKEYMVYGGNTSCFSVEIGGEIIVFDAGTGLTALGKKLVLRGVKNINILLSHPHLDHIAGLTDFAPLSDPSSKVVVWGRAGLDRDISRMIGPPIWPVSISQYPAEAVFKSVGEGETFSPVGGVKAETMNACHPGGSFIYKLEGGGKKLVYALDNEYAGNYVELEKFAYGADLMIWDASFAPGKEIGGWGHSTWSQGVELGHTACAGCVLMTHFSKEMNDELLTAMENEAGERCIFAKEGMVLTI